jgi:hypothetical protein
MESKSRGGMASTFTNEKIDIIQATWKDARAQFIKSNSEAIKKYEAEGKKVANGSTKVYEAGVCIVDRVLFAHRTDRIMKLSADRCVRRPPVYAAQKAATLRKSWPVTRPFAVRGWSLSAVT